MGEKRFEKKQSIRISWTLFFFNQFSPMSGTLFFFRPLKMISSLLSVPEIFQHQGSGNSFRGAKGSLYWSCPIQIPPKCWRWSNLVLITILPLPTSRLHLSTAQSSGEGGTGVNIPGSWGTLEGLTSHPGAWWAPNGPKHDGVVQHRVWWRRHCGHEAS